MGLKMFYVTMCVFDDGEKSGVVKKILQQIGTFALAGFTVDYSFVIKKEESIYVHSSQGIKIILGKRKIIKTVDYCKCLEKYLRGVHYDVAYVRHTGRIDPWILSVLKMMHKQDTKIVYEFPVFPYDKISVMSFTGKLDLQVDRICRRYLKKYVDRVVTFSDNKTIYNIPTLRIMNGVCVDEIKIAERNAKNEQINLLAVANFYPYHGYERIITSMGDYYKKDATREVFLHLVGGEGVSGIVEEYRLLIKKMGIADKVKFYGYKSGQDLDAIFELADIALGVFGEYKFGENKCDAIKTKEYLAKGLPVISGCNETVFDNVKDFPYYFQFPNDDSPIDMKQIIKFYDAIYGKERMGKKIHDEIREFAKKNVDMKVVLEPVIEFLKD